MTNDQITTRFMERFADKKMSLGCLVVSDSLGLGKLVFHGELHPESGFTNDRDKHKYMLIIEKKGGGLKRTRTRDKKPRIKKIIGHPLTRGRLTQEVYLAKGSNEGNKLLKKLWIALYGLRLADKTIYERVQVEKIKNLLLEFIEKYEG